MSGATGDRIEFYPWTAVAANTGVGLYASVGQPQGWGAARVVSPLRRILLKEVIVIADDPQVRLRGFGYYNTSGTLEPLISMTNGGANLGVPMADIDTTNWQRIDCLVQLEDLECLYFDLANLDPANAHNFALGFRYVALR